jgi:RNA polymerase sigma-70 factor (ECF subfamily)
VLTAQVSQTYNQVDVTKTNAAVFSIVNEDSDAPEPDVLALTDSFLLARVREGDDQSFGLLFQRHYDRVYGILFRLVGTRAEAEDLAQEVFLRLYRQRFAQRREHNVGAWLYRVAMNLGYNELRSRQRRWRRDTALLPDPTDADPAPADVAAQAETRASVRAALARLKQRDVQLLLLQQMGLSYEELAEVCGVAPGSVGTLLRRAGEAFRQAFTRVEDEDGPK